METLLPAAARIAARLKARGDTIAVAESSAGGLISAALLAVPGASAFFLAGAVIYTPKAAGGLLGLTRADVAGVRSATEPYALILAQTVRQRTGAAWGLAETGAAGPTGNGYGDPAGHACFALSGGVEAARTLRTGETDRPANMRAFAAAALALLEEALDAP